MNEEKGPEVEREDDGGYEAESSPAKRGVKGKRKDKGKGKAGKPKKVKVAPPLPAAVTPSTTTVPLVNAILGEEDVTVKIATPSFPSVLPFQPLQRWTMGSTKRRTEMESPSRTGRKQGTGNDGSGVWTCRWDRAFRRLVRREERCGRFILDGTWALPWAAFSLSSSTPRSGVLPTAGSLMVSVCLVVAYVHPPLPSGRPHSCRLLFSPSARCL